MAIDFSKYQVGGAKPQPVQTPQQPKATGSINFDKYRVSAPTQPQAPVVQPTAPTQTFTQKLQSAGSLIAGAAEKTKTLVSTGFQKLIGDNDTILQLSQDDLLKRIYKAKMSGQDASNMQKTLLAVNEAQKPEASPLKKITTGLAVRTMRAGVQLQSSAAGFGASLLDSITQITERRLKDDIKILESNPLYKPEEIQKIKDKPIKTREISNAIKKWSDETRVDNPVFAEKVVEGAGSMIGYTMIALATKSASPLTYNLLESLTESGSVYEEQRKKGKSIEEASKSADITLVGNLVVNRFLNIFDAKYEQLKPIKRAFQNAGIEGTQEAAQQIISNLTTDRPWDEGVLEAAGIGATLGGITTVALPSGERMILDENTKKITKVEPGKPPVIIQPQKAPVQEEEKPVEVTPVVPMAKQQPDLSKVTSEKDKQDYETILKPKIDALPETKPNEVVVIQTGTGEYVDTQVDEALSRGVNENTKVMVVNKNDISLTDNNEKNLRGERLLKTPTTGIKQTIKQDHLEALKSEARKYKSADGGFYGTDEAGWKLVNNSNGKISTERLYLLKQEAELYPNVKKFIENFDDSDLTKSQLTDIYTQATAEKKQSKPEVKKPAKKKTISKDQTKAIKVAKKTLEKVTTRLREIISAAQAKSVIARESRAGLNIENINKLKLIYSRTKAFQEGDIETIRNSSYKKLVNTVIENVQEMNPWLNESEAFDFAVNLPTKADESGRAYGIKELKKEQKILNKYIEDLQNKQVALTGDPDISIDELKKGDELYNEWQNVLIEQEKLAKIIEVEQGNLPTGTGKQRISKLEARMKGVIGNATDEQIEQLGLATYNQMNKEETVAKAIEYVTENTNDALDVLSGKKDAPSGLSPEAIYVAMTQLGKDDLGLATRIASLQATALGQRISILSEIDKDSPVKYINEVYNLREESFKNRTKKTSDKAVKQEVETIKKEVKKAEKYDWNAFVKSIQC